MYVKNREFMVSVIAGQAETVYVVCGQNAETLSTRVIQ